MRSIEDPAPDTLHSELIQDPEVPAELRRQWDDLAVASATPYCAPDWMLAWWRFARPPGAALMLIAVWRGDELYGIFPFYAERVHGLTRYRLLASTISAHVQPLARDGAEQEVTDEATQVLGSAVEGPYVISLHGLSAHSSWPSRFVTRWAMDRGSWTRWGSGMPAPRLLLEGDSYEEWIARLSRHRRAELRRRRRRLEEAGASVRLVSEANEVRHALPAFFALHHARWRPRGGSGVLDAGIEGMLAHAAEELVPSSRMRLWSIEADGETVASSLFVAAGGTLSYWLGGFDERWAQYGPAIETVRAALEHAWRVGDRLLDFGPGGQHYKYTFAYDADVVHPVDLIPRTRGSVRVRLRLAPEHVMARAKAARYWAVGRLSPGTQQWLKFWRKRFQTRP
jgi:CelD/BcsL family acetyltransferase involved in cellulose biosynthesis